MGKSADVENVGNTDDSKRGRGLGVGGKAAPPGRKLSGTPGKAAGRSVDDPDTDGRPIGRGKK
jgi:hypothetical protein